MVRSWLLALLVAGCGSFGTTAPTPDAAASDAAPIDAGAPPDAGRDGSLPEIAPLDSCKPPGFCEDFEASFPAGWTPDALGTGGSFNPVPGQSGGTALAIDVPGEGNAIRFSRLLPASRAIRCEHDILVGTWAEEQNWFGAAFNDQQGAFTNWYSYWGTQNGTFAIQHSVKSKAGQAWDDTPKKLQTNPGEWRHVRYALDLGDNPSFSTEIVGVETLAIDAEKATPTDGKPLNFLIRFGIFDVKQSASRKITIDNIRCQAI